MGSTSSAKNGGQTPASSVRVSFGFQEYSHGQPFPSDIVYNANIYASPTAGEHATRTSYYMLQGDIEHFWTVPNFPMFLRATNGISSVVIYGTIEFVDIFGDTHMTDFCRMYQAFTDKRRGYEDCPEHNGER